MTPIHTDDLATMLLARLTPSGVLNDAETPGRYVRALEEMLSGYATDPKALLRCFEDTEADEIVVVRDIPFASVCEHHVLPFFGHAHVAYVPKGKIVGLSKIPRLVEAFARRLQVQERLTRQIAQALHEHVGAAGVAVILRGQHSCMRLRGARSPGDMITSSLLGVFRTDPAARAEALQLIGGW